MKILIVDDEAVNREFIKFVFKDTGLEVIEAANGEEALRVIEKEKPDVILLDIIMPGVLGYEVCKKVKSNPETMHIPIIMLTALGDSVSKTKALELGADEYITKPFDKNELILRVRNMIKIKKYYELIKDYNQVLEEEVRKKTFEIKEAYKKLDEAYLELVYRLGRAAEYRDDETGEHAKRVGKMCAVLAKALGMDEENVKIIEYASPLHDIGKIGIPDSILLKPGKLTDEEFEIMKRHTIIGAKILEGSEYPVLKAAAIIALTHHERWDGSGYPKGLKGEEIPIEGRICGIIDVFDACTSFRVYRAAMGISETLQLIREGKGTLFDPKIVDAFFSCIKEIIKVKEKLSSGIGGNR